MKEITIHSPKYGTFSSKVDDDDYGWLTENYRWIVNMSDNGKIIYLEGRRHGHGYDAPSGMQRVICKKHYGESALDGKSVDHIDRDGLNNQKSNLRICTKSQNRANSEKCLLRPSTSQYKGVYKSRRGLWSARVISGKTTHCLGSYHAEREAAIAYDIKARRLFGEFICPNILDASEEEIDRISKHIDSQKKTTHTTSRYYGVCWATKNRCWSFHYPKDGHTGRRYGFATELEAAIARNRFIDDNNLAVKKTQI